jgi:hypothetical protein
MTEPVAERFSRTRGKLALWAGLLVPPAAWMLHLLVSYSLQRYICRTGAVWLFHLTTAATLLPVIAVGWVAWRAWRDTGAPRETTGSGVLGRSRFMALSGVALSIAFAVLILVEWIPVYLLDPCGGGLLLRLR